MTAPTNTRVVHPDGTESPFDVQFVGREPRMVNDEPVIFDIYEAIEVLVWREGDRVAFDCPDCDTGFRAIRTTRVREQ